MLEVISVPFSLFFSIKSKTSFFISIFSTTTSIIQSAFFIFFISSFKFPNSMLFLFLSKYREDGFVLRVVKKDSVTILFLTILSVKESPFFFSDSDTLLGEISNNKTFTPMFAK